MSSLIYSQGAQLGPGRSLQPGSKWASRCSIGLISFIVLASVHAPTLGQSVSSTAPLLIGQATNPTSRPTLRPGSQGSAVSELQAMLQLLGYYNGAVDGIYQDSTAQAVTAFQRAAGIQPDGIVGPSTWQKLLPPAPGAIAATPTPSPSPSPAPSPTPSPSPAPARAASPAPSSSPSATATEPVTLPILRVGMRGPAVERLQERLRALGYFDGAVDGVFGPQTQAAVQEAQRNSSLDPDGIVGPATWTAILRE